MNIWKEGKSIDLWSVNHLLSGGVSAGLTIFLKFDFLIGLLLASFIMLSWELYEFFGEIKESPMNQTIDMVFGVLGFIISYPLMIKMNATTRIGVFTIITLLFLFLETRGFLAYKKRSR